MTLSFHDVVCDPAQRPAAVQALKDIPDVFSIERCHRGRDMMLTVITPSLMWLTEHVYPQLDQVPGLQRYESSFCTRLHHIAAEWRLGVLYAHQQRRLREAAGQRSPYTGRTPSHFAAILRELARDGRASAAQIAAATGLNPPTVRRQLRQVLDSRAVTIRCETSHRAAGFPVVCEWFCRLPAAEHEDAAAALRSMSSLWLCTSVTGPANFSFMMCLRSPADIMTVEQRIAAHIPGLEVLESVVTEIPKRVGRVLDADGRSTGQAVLPGPRMGVSSARGAPRSCMSWHPSGERADGCRRPPSSRRTPMTAALRPYLNFPGNAREAFEFYGEVLGGTPELATFADFGAVPADSEHADKIMHGALEIDDLIRLYVSDFVEGMAPGEFVKGNDVTLALMGEDSDEERLTAIFDALADGGTVTFPLGKQVWGGIYGAVTDRYGIFWQFNIGG